MTHLFKRMAAFAIVALLAASCQKDNTTPASDKSGVSLSKSAATEGVTLLSRTINTGDTAQVRNLKSDSIIPPNSPAPFYYSLSTESTVTAFSASRSLQFNGYFNADINGVNNFILAYIDNIAYGSINATNAISSSTAATGNKLGYNSVNAGWYNYFFNDNHKVLPVAGRTIIAYKKVGTVISEIYKIKMLSIYKDMPANPTGTEPIPYLSFDYQRLQ
ncbi:hypothetical protein [Chitinophaga solisilvae]|uniref:Heme-binding HmuY-like protein n=1 Tax=Chitinophaga solisilvae TaxID=1233460 RepID=A0A9Q5D689_9BACT|nr:hypothetical protein [Chitinophaga solisilvae]NSL88719.1 hypothetical protein [Chitinophaga solisilvae]